MKTTSLLLLMLSSTLAAAEPPTLNQRADGYRGIWYMNQPSGDEYVYKYSGGLGTYCQAHRPLAVYCPEVRKTFFCYGGTTEGSHLRITAGEQQSGSKLERSRDGFLLHMVSYYDHRTGMVPRPTILLDKQTADAHDNPVIAVDPQGFVWIFSTSHGRSRPSYIHKSKTPYAIDEFELVPATHADGGKDVPMTNFSYMQPWPVADRGFVAFFTRYNYPVARTLCFMTSPDGIHWSEWQRLAAMGEGSYQTSEIAGTKAGTAFNYHPAKKGVNWRTNLYYVETDDFGKTWHAAGGKPVVLPLADKHNDALVREYEAEGLNVYMKDLAFDGDRRPVILYITSKGYQSGPQNDPRTWTTARWTGKAWEIRPVTTSGNNYDFGPLYIEADGTWRIIAPTETGPQPYNPGGEMVLWTSGDQGKTWHKVRQITFGSPRNHTFARRPAGAHPDFYALWADGDARKPSESRLYFSDRSGIVYQLPAKMGKEFEKPVRMGPGKGP